MNSIYHSLTAEPTISLCVRQSELPCSQSKYGFDEITASSSQSIISCFVSRCRSRSCLGEGWMISSLDFDSSILCHIRDYPKSNLTRELSRVAVILMIL
jgi:hypothetical protein